MTQRDFGTIDPSTKTGSALASDLNDFRDAQNTNHSGVSRPTYVQSGMIWIDTSSSAIWNVKLFDGADDIVLYQLDTTNNIARMPPNKQESVKTADYTLTLSDAYFTLVMNKSSAGIVTLPALSTTNSEVFCIYNSNASNVVTVTPNGSDTISSDTTFSSNVLYSQELMLIWPDVTRSTWRKIVTRATISPNYSQSFSAVQQEQVRSNISAALKGQINGLIISNNTTDPTNDWDITAGEAASNNLSNSVLMVLPSAMTKRIDASWAAGSGNGGLDTGTASTTGTVTYHVHLIYNPTLKISDILISLSPTAPTLPSGYTHFRRICSQLRVNGVNVPMTQIDNRFYKTTLTVDRNSTATASAALLTLTVPAGVQIKPIISGYMTNSSGSAQTQFGNGFGATAAIFCTRVNGTATGGYVNESVYTNTSAQIRLTVTTDGAISENLLFTHGWIDERGAY